MKIIEIITEEEISSKGSSRVPLDFDKVYGNYLKVTDNSGDSKAAGFSLVTPLNRNSWNWNERPEFKDMVRQRLNDPVWLDDHKYNQIISAMQGEKFNPDRHLVTPAPPKSSVPKLKSGGGSGGARVSDTRDMQLGSELDPKRLIKKY